MVCHCGVYVIMCEYALCLHGVYSMCIYKGMLAQIIFVLYNAMYVALYLQLAVQVWWYIV